MKLNFSTKASMIICAITYLLSLSSTLYAQVNTWTQQQPSGITATPRYGAVSFSIGSKGYIGTGYDVAYKKDFWEYEPGTNIWTQKADFGGPARNNAVGFAIGIKGYIGTGIEVHGSTSTVMKDFWEYDPGTNIWTQKADFGGSEREAAIGFAIGTKGYIGTGADFFFTWSDFWEYDPGTNIWTQKADFLGGERQSATGFAIGTKGYIGTGAIPSGFEPYMVQDFWEYDPGINVWTQKADYGGSARLGATGFAIGTNGYIGFGLATDGLKNDLWEYSTPGGVLPVSLTNFDGKRVIHVNELKWQTASEINVAYYSIEHSRDGVNFSALSSILSIGNNQSAKSYSYTDHLPFSNITFYRLKIVDRDERFTYSKIIAIKDDKGKSLIIFPNPAKDILFVQVSRENEHASIQVLDAMGRKIKEEKVDGNISITIDIKDLPAGIYTLVLKNQLKTEQQRFIKQ